MKKRRWRLLAAALLAVVLLAAASRVPYLQTLYFGPMTCPASEEGMVQYAEDLFDRAQYGREITVLKTAQEGRAWAILYEEATTQDRYLMTFESQFFGLRLRQIGMNNFHEDGVLYLSGGWRGTGRGAKSPDAWCRSTAITGAARSRGMRSPTRPRRAGRIWSRTIFWTSIFWMG